MKDLLYVILFAVCDCSLSSLHLWREILSILVDVAMLAIGVTNIFVCIKIFTQSSHREDVHWKQQHNLEAFRTLVLDAKIPTFYESMEKIKVQCEKLTKKDLDKAKRDEINKNLLRLFANLRLQFIDLLLAIDKDRLYIPILQKSDALSDALTGAIYDEGINLSHPPMYHEKIDCPIEEAKTEIIRVLYGFEG